MKEDNNWKSTNYHSHVQEQEGIELENDQWYEIGFQNQFNKDFVHQGIRQYNGGFFDDNDYHLKPFPSHARKIELTVPKGQFVLKK